MKVTHLLDTSVFSQPIKDHPVEQVLERWSRLRDAAVCTSALCLAELLSGLEQRGSKKYWRRYQELLENRYPSLPLDEGVAQVYAVLDAKTRSRGKPRPVVDLLIAATAEHHGLTLATLNSRDFGKIPGLLVEDWSGS
jgi:predicted nucleic acid-binding protein